MTFLHALILGIVEGMTEFIPVSSTGHLILTTKILGIPGSAFVTTFIIAIQAGALLAVVIPFLKTFFKNPKSIVPIVIACIPAVVVGFLALDTIKSVIAEGSLLVLGLALLLGGIVLLYIERWYEKKSKTPPSSSAKATAGQGSPLPSEQDISEQPLPTNMQALKVGVVQLLALIPGVSRSGATVAGGLLAGMARPATVSFSFLVAVPLIFGATALDLVKSPLAFSSHEWLMLVAGFVSAFIASLIVVRSLLRFVSKHSFRGFAWYRIVLGAILLVVALA
jgi:undecaprenyl-diphosphatase